MDNNAQHNGNERNGLFSILYRTRIVIRKEDTVIINLSVLFSILALLFAPWVVVIGAIVALILGYRFAIDRNAAGFSGSFENVVKDAAGTVKRAVENATGHQDDDDTRPDHDREE